MAVTYFKEHFNMIDVKKPLENANLTVNCEYMDLFDMSSHSERKIYLNDER